MIICLYCDEDVRWNKFFDCFYCAACNTAEGVEVVEEAQDENA